MNRLREALRNAPSAELRDDLTSVSFRELDKRCELQSAHRAFEVFAPRNTADDAVRMLSILCNRTTGALAHGRASQSEQSDYQHRLALLTHVQPGLIISTSGSSGQPKLVQLPTERIVAQAQAVNEFLRADTNDCWLLCLPLYHVGGMAILPRAMLAGASVRLTAQSDARSLSQLLDDEPITLVSLVPALLERILAVRNGRPLPERVRAILVGGGPVPDDLIQRVPQALKTYGMTETGSMVTCVSLNADGDARFSAGRAIPHAAVKITDDRDEEVGAGKPGRIAVRSAGLASGYADSPEQTALVFREGWFATEDLGYVDDHGLLHVIGRRDRMIISGGENIALDEIEAAARELPLVSAAACVALSDPDWGQSSGLAIVALPPYTADELRRLLLERLPRFKLPRRFVMLRELPLLPSGKVDYLAVQELFAR